MFLYQKLDHVGSPALPELASGLHSVIVLLQFVEDDAIDFVFVQLLGYDIVWKDGFVFVSAGFDLCKQFFPLLQGPLHLVFFNLTGFTIFQLLVHGMVNLPCYSLHERSKHSDQDRMAEHEENHDKSERAVTISIIVDNGRPLRLH